MVKEQISAKVDGEWIRCGVCGFKLAKVEAVYMDGPPKCTLEIKCKGKHNGKTCNSFNRIVL